MTAEEEAQFHLDQAAEEERKAAELLKEQARQLENQAEDAERGSKGGSTSSWNPFTS